MKNNLTTGSISKGLFAFAGPMIAGNLLQQIYNLADTYIVGRFLGEKALAAVGGTYTLTTFLYSVIIGFCMGCGTLVSYCFGQGDRRKMKQYIDISFLVTALLSVILEIFTIVFSRRILQMLNIPKSIMPMTDNYVKIILVGIAFIFLYNFYAYVRRGVGDSTTPLIFLIIASIANVFLDILFVVQFKMGVDGAAYATLISQIFCGVGLLVYCLWKMPEARWNFVRQKYKKEDFIEVLKQSGASSVQQSVMNFGILMIQGLINSFGTIIMAAFTIAVKVDTLAYMPAQEFGNAFSIFVSQNYGAKEHSRIKKGVKRAFVISGIFCVIISIIVFVFSKELMQIFVNESVSKVVNQGSIYLKIEGACYIGIGFLFLFYGYFRGIKKPHISLLLTIISLGTRVVIAYAFAQISVISIWVAIPIGWVLADIVGFIIMKKAKLL